MKTALFLGAGASVFAGQPTTEDLLQLLRSHLQKRRNNPEPNISLQDHVEHIVVGAEAYTDVEKLYDGIEAIIAIQNNPNCEPISERFQYYYGVEHSTVGLNYTTKTPHSIPYKEISNELSKLRDTIRETILNSFKIKTNTYENIVEMYDMVREVIERNSTDEFQVFTTNYDTVLDIYASKKGFETINGFKPPHDLRRVWDNMWDSATDKPPLYLAKLHGSIQWYRDEDVIVETGGVALRDAVNDIMIAPTEGAKHYDEPLSSLMDRFKDVLQDTDVLLVIGFSYRDNEIVRNIKDRLSEGMVLISISPTATEDIHQHVSTTTPKTVNGNSDLKVIEPNIILCKQEFEPKNLDVLRATLDDAYELVRRMCGRNGSAS